MEKLFQSESRHWKFVGKMTKLEKTCQMAMFFPKKTIFLLSIHFCESILLCARVKRGIAVYWWQCIVLVAAAAA